MESIIQTKASTVLEFIQGLRGDLWVAFEEGLSAEWLYDLLKPHVARVVVCDPRKNALLKAGNPKDRVDARKLVELLHTGMLSPQRVFATCPPCVENPFRSRRWIRSVPRPAGNPNPPRQSSRV